MKFSLYILYSPSSDKTYVGYTNNLERRLWEHNNSSKRSFTSRFRPWELIYTEEFETNQEAMQREKWFKTGVGREQKAQILATYKSNI